VTYNCLKAGIEDFSDVSWAFAIEQSLSYLAALLIRQFWLCPELDTTRLCFGPPDANEFLMVVSPVMGTKLGQVRSRRYCFHFDEVAEAEAQGLPYVLVPRILSLEEWEKKYCVEARGMGEEIRTAGAGEREKK
jgi:hypothetical protein